MKKRNKLLTQLIKSWFKLSDMQKRNLLCYAKDLINLNHSSKRTKLNNW
jgi:hypothetical protein